MAQSRTATGQNYCQLVSACVHDAGSLLGHDADKKWMNVVSIMFAMSLPSSVACSLLFFFLPLLLPPSPLPPPWLAPAQAKLPRAKLASQLAISPFGSLECFFFSPCGGGRCAVNRLISSRWPASEEAP